MSTGYIYRRNLRFADTDMAGVGHFASVLVLVEEAWHAWLTNLGESVHPATAPAGAEPVGWPVVSVKIDYRHPVRFGDAIAVLLLPSRIGARSIQLQFSLDGPDGEFASGTFTAVCTTQISTGEWQSRAIPHSLAAKLSSQR